jgi:uncharacterized protein YutE (UPF0331/DUF86 family)
MPNPTDANPQEAPSTSTDAVETNFTASSQTDPDVSTPDTSATEAGDAKNTAPDTSPVDENKQVDKQPKSLMEAVKAAAQKDAEEGTSTTPTQKSTVSDPETTTDNAPTDEAKTDEEEGKDEKVPFHKHPRWQEMIRERDSFKNDATQYRQITAYMAQNSLTTEEVAKGFEIMSALRNDPLRAREMLSHYTKALDQFAGVILPDDLSQKVEEGTLDEQAAQELARTRNEAAMLQQRYAQMEQNRQFEASVASQAAIQTTVNHWEETIKTRDADYAAKQGLIMDRARSYLINGQPQTPQQALEIVERAYADVNESLKGFAPRKQPIRPVTSQNSSTNSQPVARTLQEAIRMAAAQTT